MRPAAPLLALRTLFATLLLASLGPSAARAIQVEPVPFAIETDLWLLNGDPTLQPELPLAQRLVAPAVLGTETLIVTPTLLVPSDLGGRHRVAITRTTMGGSPRFPNPGDPDAPFAPSLELQLANDVGSFTASGAPSGGFGGILPLRVRLALSDDGVTVEIPSGEAFPFGTSVSATFQVEIPQLLEPVAGTAFGSGWTTGRVTVMKGCDVLPPRTCPAPDVTLTATGSRHAERVSLVTPVVLETVWGEGGEQAPFTALGFFHLRLPEPGIAAPLLLAALALGWRARPGRSRT